MNNEEQIAKNIIDAFENKKPIKFKPIESVKFKKVLEYIKNYLDLQNAVEK